jgi:hypothetical protein
LRFAVVAWILVLAGSGTWAILNGPPTDREETTVAQALPVVNQAAVDLVAAIGLKRDAVAVMSNLTFAGPCRVSQARPGVRYVREVDAYYSSTDPPAGLLDDVAGRLPARYRATVSPPGTPVRFFADAGLYVAINGVLTGPGSAKFVIDTGACRVAGNLVTPGTVTPDPQVAAPFDPVLQALRLSAGPVTAYEVACPAGPPLTTVTMHVGGEPGALDGELADLAGVTPVVREVQRYALRTSAGVEVTVLAHSDGVDLVATRPCG